MIGSMDVGKGTTTRDIDRDRDRNIKEKVGMYSGCCSDQKGMVLGRGP